MTDLEVQELLDEHGLTYKDFGYKAEWILARSANDPAIIAAEIERYTRKLSHFPPATVEALKKEVEGLSKMYKASAVASSVAARDLADVDLWTRCLAFWTECQR